jgi:hypothetical protein
MRATLGGVDSTRAIDALDAEDPHGLLVELIVEAELADPPQAGAPTPQPALRQQPPSASAARPDRPHFAAMGLAARSPGPAPAFARAKPTPATLPEGRKPSSSTPRPLLGAANKHCMLSYQWDNQDAVVKARKLMQRHGLSCWMDIDGGIIHPAVAATHDINRE